MRRTASSSSRSTPPSLSNPAVARCAKAWQRTYDRIVSAAPNHGEDAEKIEDFARDEAEAAFRNALPPLSGEENIRDFIACVGHALVKEILLPIVCTDYLEAAKVALSAVRAHRKSRSAGPSNGRASAS